MDAELLSFLFNVFLFIGVVIAIRDRDQIKQLVQKVNQLQQQLEQQTITS